MCHLALILLALASSTRVELVDEIYEIPPAEWRYVEFTVKQHPVRVSCDFSVASGAQEIRLALLRRYDLERLRTERPHGMLASAGPGASGKFDYQLHTPGDYVVVIDNRADASNPARVKLRLSLDFAPTAGPAVTYLSPRRQIAVILISFAVFFAIVTYSARKLLRAVRR
jgi:hypothetical protein